MNNLFLFAGILFFYCSMMTDGIVHQNKGALKEKNVNGAMLKQKRIQMKECSNIPLECYDCFCGGGKHASGNDKSTSLQGTKRVKRGDPNWSRLCARCQRSWVYSTTYCEGCSYFVQNDNLYSTKGNIKFWVKISIFR
jgi:hypothetical protein